jgi:hypothetical protein
LKLGISVVKEIELAIVVATGERFNSSESKGVKWSWIFVECDLDDYPLLLVGAPFVQPATTAKATIRTRVENWKNVFCNMRSVRKSDPIRLHHSMPAGVLVSEPSRFAPGIEEVKRDALLTTAIERGKRTAAPVGPWGFECLVFVFSKVTATV